MKSWWLKNKFSQIGDMGTILHILCIISIVSIEKDLS